MHKNILKTKRDSDQKQLRENVGKPKKLWKAFKSLDLPSKIAPVSQISLKDEEKIFFDEKANNNSFAPTLL